MLKSLQVPAQPTEHQQALTRLKAIEGIIVNKKAVRDGHSVYVIDLFVRGNTATGLVSPASVPRSQLALHDLTAANGQHLIRDHHGDRKPDHSVGKTFLEVFELQDALYNAAFACRCIKRCRQCQQMFDYIRGGDQTPAAIVRALMLPGAKKRLIEEKITAFIGVVVRTQILTTNSSELECKSADNAPLLIKTFLEL